MKSAKRLENIRRNNNNNYRLVNYDLYKLVKDKDLLIAAYESIKSNKGSTTNATSESENIDGFSLNRVDKIIAKLNSETWNPKPARRVNIPKKNNKTRPIGIQGADEKVVQTAVKFILESIYEPVFLNNSHGFRPKRGCHSALEMISQQFDGMHYLVEGDIKGMFNNVNHDVLINILRRKIKDEKFLRLIRKFLRAGYMEINMPLVKPLTGTPQGSTLSPILANIYLHELDLYMMRKWITTHRSRRNTIKNKAYTKLSSVIRRLQRNIGSTELKEEKVELIRQLKLVKKERLKLPYSQEESKAIRIKYVRYADDFIVGVSGPRKIATNIKEEIRAFVADKLSLELSEKKTVITDIRKDRSIFLGYSIRIDTSIKITKVHTKGRSPFMKRTTGFLIKLEVPMQRLIQRLALKGFCTAKGFPLPKRAWTIFDDFTIVSSYNSVFRGYINYYSGADNQNALYRLKYIMRFSLAMTLAARHRSSISKEIKKHGKYFRIMLETKNKAGKKKIREVEFVNPKFNKSSKHWQVGTKFGTLESFVIGKRTRTKLFGECCICGNGAVHMHHIRHVKKASKGSKQTFQTLMGLINRKQIPVCLSCHANIHNGKYDGKNLRDLVDPDFARR